MPNKFKMDRVSINKLTIFDTHCHLADERYRKQSKNTKEIVQEAKKAGVKYILNVGYNKQTSQQVVEQLIEFSNLFGALGLHPNSQKDLTEENLQWIEKQLTNQRIVAIGEIGLDYYRAFTEVKKQKKWFEKQLELAKKYDLPVLLHIRGEENEDKFENAFVEAYEIVKKVGIKRGVLHCFTGTWEVAQKFINLGFYISLAGNITRKTSQWNKRIEQVIKEIPLTCLVVETDAPYLIPEPVAKKEKINYPYNIIYTLKKIAEVKKIDLEVLSKIIYQNTLELLEIKVVKD